MQLCALDEVDGGTENNFGKPYLRLEPGFLQNLRGKSTRGDTAKITRMCFGAFEFNQ